MTDTCLSIEDISRLTLQVGEDWAIAHAKRLIELVKWIGPDLVYDGQVTELAAYLHDWGAFSSYAQKGVEHAVRSRQVVEAELMPRLDLSAAQRANLLEAIELHDYRDPRPPQSTEALLLREADMLGMAREFARGPKNVETCYRRILSRREAIRGRFTLPRAQELARERLERMDTGLAWLVDESFGVL